MVSHTHLTSWYRAAMLATCGATGALACLACRGEAGSEAAWDGAVRDSAGIQIVENYGTPLWPEGDRWEFTEVFRIGVAEGAPEYEFGRISGLAVLSDRRIVVADALGHHLRFFSPDGDHERTVGREGQGPGEFGSGALWLTVGPGDTLLVLDRANQQGHAIAPDGTWLESFSTLPRGPYRSGLWADEPGSGRLVSYHVPVRHSDGSFADTLDLVLERDVYGAVLDTLVRLPSYTYQTASRGVEAVLQHYFRGVPDIALCGDEVVTGLNDAYRFLRYGPGGSLDRIVNLARERPAMTDEDRSVMMRRWDETLQENRVSAERAAEIKSSLSFADSYPAYCLFICGPSATTLVQRVRPLRDLSASEKQEIRIWLARPPGAAEWDVFDRDGRYLGAAVIPGTAWSNTWRMLRFFRDRASGTWYMYSVWSDEQDVEYVVAWRLDGYIPEATT